MRIGVGVRVDEGRRGARGAGADEERGGVLRLAQRRVVRVERRLCPARRVRPRSCSARDVEIRGKKNVSKGKGERGRGGRRWGGNGGDSRREKGYGATQAESPRCFRRTRHQTASRIARTARPPSVTPAMRPGDTLWDVPFEGSWVASAPRAGAVASEDVGEGEVGSGEDRDPSFDVDDVAVEGVEELVADTDTFSWVGRLCAEDVDAALEPVLAGVGPADGVGVAVAGSITVAVVVAVDAPPLGPPADTTLTPPLSLTRK